MKKRIVAVFMAFTLLYLSICVRLYGIATQETQVASGTVKKYTIDVASVRGDILDCNGNKLVSADYENIVAAKPTYKALSTLENVLDEEAYAFFKERVRNQSAVTISIGKFEIDETEDTVMLRKFFRYSDSQLADHIIGYVNGEGRGVCGIEGGYDDVLFTGKNLSVSFSSDVYGRTLGGMPIIVNNRDVSVGTVTLTIDSEIQEITENALDENGIICGGAVVVDVRTGAIKAMVSRPDFDAKNISEYLNDETSSLLNRTINPYSVGSVFKTVIAATAIEYGYENFIYECKGSCDVDGTVFSCNNKTEHGVLDIKKALECSCNTFFIEIARNIGAEKILETASFLGFGQEENLAKGVVSKSGVIPSSQELSNSGELANFSFGQGRFTATMLQLSNVFCAIAGNGKYHKPYLAEKVTSADGTIIYEHNNEYPVYALEETTVNKLTEMLVSVIDNGNAQKAKLENGVKAAGKTATAQTGRFDENGKEIFNTWFAGYFVAEKTEYAVVVLKENGVSGAVDCAPIFKCIADEIICLEKNS